MGSELRQKWWSRPLGHLLWAGMTLICATLRKRVDKSMIEYMGSQSIFALWHNRIFCACYINRYVIKSSIPVSMLTSASKDGAMLATIAQNYGMRAVRGSSRRRGVAGFRDMMRELSEGCHMCITPDGPKGPLYSCHPGVIKLASMSGVPIVPVKVRYSKCWRAKTWDRFIVPIPFSRVEMIPACEPFYVPRDLSDAELETWCHRLENLLGTDDEKDPFITS